MKIILLGFSLHLFKGFEVVFEWWVGAGWQKTVRITVNVLVEREEKSRPSKFDVGFCLVWFFLIKKFSHL